MNREDDGVTGPTLIINNDRWISYVRCNQRKKMIEMTLEKGMKVTTFTNQHVFSISPVSWCVCVYLHWGFSQQKKYKSNYNTKYKYEHESFKLRMHDQTSEDINKKVNVQLFCTRNFFEKNGIIFYVNLCLCTSSV